jgi:hypothetical protein
MSLAQDTFATHRPMGRKEHHSLKQYERPSAVARWGYSLDGTRGARAPRLSPFPHPRPGPGGARGAAEAWESLLSDGNGP